MEQNLLFIEKYREKLFHTLVETYGKEKNFSVEELKDKFSFDKEDWKNTLETNIETKKVKIKNADENNKQCKARIWNKDRSDIRCSKKCSEGDFCTTHNKEINEKCKTCSRIFNKDIIHIYRWEKCGSIDQEITPCFWGGTNKKKVNSEKKQPKRKTAWTIFCEEHREKIKKTPGESISKILGKMWRDLRDLERKSYEKKADRYNNSLEEILNEQEDNQEININNEPVIKNLKKESKNSEDNQEININIEPVIKNLTKESKNSEVNQEINQNIEPVIKNLTKESKNSEDNQEIDQNNKAVKKKLKIKKNKEFKTTPIEINDILYLIDKSNNKLYSTCEENKLVGYWDPESKNKIRITK